MTRLVALVPLVVLALTGSAQAVSFRDGFGIHVRSARALDPRLISLSVGSAAIPGAANVRILLPSGYASHRHRRYGVLHLFHGTSGGAADWTVMGDAERTTAGKPLIVVMPDIGLNGDGGGWCTNWVSFAPNHQWETFHIAQLVPWVDANLRTIARRGGRAVAGLSQGGFCSMSYAARHPDLFGIALSYSGVPDTAYDAAARVGFSGVLAGIEAGLDHVAAGSLFGPVATNEINWAAHDPTTLAGNLRNTKMLLYTGNGSGGPLDPRPYVGVNATEVGVHLLTQLFHERLLALKIPSFYKDYGPGTHSWPYWARDLRESIGPVTAAFRAPAGPPKSFSYTSGDALYTDYGWTVTMHRQVRELSTLSSAGVSGFGLSGSGSASVVTGPLFGRSRRYSVETFRGRSGSHQTVLTAGRDRRVRIEVPLGPSNTVQEFPLGGPPIGTAVYTTRVTIAAAR